MERGLLMGISPRIVADTGPLVLHRVIERVNTACIREGVAPDRRFLRRALIAIEHAPVIVRLKCCFLTG